MNIAVFTGASSGMGQEFVRQIVSKDVAFGKKSFDEVWLIARRTERLQALADTLPIPARIFTMDLTDRAAIKNIYRQALSKEKPNVRILVNASGFGKFGAFTEIPCEENDGMLDLNAGALVSMTYETLPYMRAGSQIYELCSLSSFQPVPYISVYGATKAFVLSFSRAINMELRKKGISVMAVCPGWVKTEFFDRAVHDDTIVYYNRFFTAEQVVTRAISDMNKGKDVSICGASIRFQVFLTKILPHRLVMKIWCRQQKK